MEGKFEQPNREGVIRKIEAVPIDRFWDRPDDTEWNTDTQDAVEADLAAEQEEAGRLSYVPFYPSAELRRVRRLSPEEKSLPKEEKRRLRRERLETLKRGIEYQRQGLALAVQELYRAITDHPDLGIETYMTIVEDGLAPQYRFNEGQINAFRHAMHKYIERHAMVEKYRERYPDDTKLFEECFGREPIGRIEIIKGPMTLHFRCFNKEDYIAAYWYQHTLGVQNTISEEQVRFAGLSGGAALHRVRFLELTDAVTIENAMNHMVDLRRIPTSRTETLQERAVELYLPEQKGDINIRIDGVGEWRFEIPEKDMWDSAGRIRLVKTGESEPLFDAKVVDAPEEAAKFGVFRQLEDISGPEIGKRRGNASAHLLDVGGRSVGYVWIAPNISFVKIEAYSHEMTLKYTTDGVIPVFSQEASERTRIHEEQHQFNKLFVPSEILQGYLTMMERITEATDSPDAARRELIHNMVRYERRWMTYSLDTRARDEILAYYRDGKDPATILSIFSTSPLYDYVKQSGEAIARIPEKVVKGIKENITESLFRAEPDEEGYSEYYIDARALEVNPEEVKPFIDVVFKDEYQTDLKSWLDAITALEQKGYDRMEIVSILYTEPARGWAALARRIGNKNEHSLEPSENQ